MISVSPTKIELFNQTYEKYINHWKLDAQTMLLKLLPKKSAFPITLNVSSHWFHKPMF